MEFWPLVSFSKHNLVDQIAKWAPHSLFRPIKISKIITTQETFTLDPTFWKTNVQTNFNYYDHEHGPLLRSILNRKKKHEEIIQAGLSIGLYPLRLLPIYISSWPSPLLVLKAIGRELISAPRLQLSTLWLSSVTSSFMFILIRFFHLPCTDDNIAK